ncbi:MAG: GC-type dockerin domain-anchored protein [Phycisphaerales bacterium]
MKRWMVVLAAMAFGGTNASAHEVLVAIGGPATNPIGTALRDLEIDFESGVGAEDFLFKLRSQEWDLVVVQTLNRFLPLFEFPIYQELEAHVDRGGTLHFQMADLENLPSYWHGLLGIDGAVDLELPLQPILVPTPAHPLWNTGGGGGFIGLKDERYPPDYGDSLVLAPGTFAVGYFGIDGPPAVAIGRDGRVVINGQQWDNWQSGADVAANQLRWILSCKADFDSDGDLTIFDFVAFQNLFDAGDPAADVFYDGRLDVFDFLAFFNQFEDGC